MGKIGFLLSFCLMMTLTCLSKGASAQEPIVKPYSLEIKELSEEETSSLRSKLAFAYITDRKILIWSSLIYRGIIIDKSIKPMEEAEKFYNWLLAKGDTKQITQGLILTMFHFRYNNYPDGLYLAKKYLSKSEDKVSKPDFMHLSNMLGYDFASYLKLEIQNDLYIPILDFMNQYEPTELPQILRLGSALIGYGQVLMRKKRPTDALEYFFRAAKIFDNHPDSKRRSYVIDFSIAEAFLKTKNYERSEFYVKKTIINFPDSRLDGRIQMPALLAATRLGLKDPHSALEILKTGEDQITNPRDDYKIYFLEIYMEVLTKLEEYTEAFEKGNEALSLATKLGNNEVQSRLNYKIGYIHAKVGNYSLGEKLILNSIKVLKEIHGFDDPDAYAALIELYTLEGSRDKAKEAETKQVEAEKHIKKMINHDILADLKSISELRDAQRIENQKRNNDKNKELNNLAENKILTFFTNFFILLLILAAIRMIIIFKNSSKV